MTPVGFGFGSRTNIPYCDKRFQISCSLKDWKEGLINFLQNYQKATIGCGKQ